MAEFHQLMETLDSLWFFRNALSPPAATNPVVVSLESEEDSEESEEEQEQEQSSNPIEIIQTSDEITIDHGDGDSNSNAIPSSPEQEIDSEIESPLPAVAAAGMAEKQSNGGEIVFESKPESPLERRKRMARRSKSKRKMLLELDLCFDDLNLFFPRSYGGGGGGSFGRSYGILVSQREDRREIPALNDSLAMKRHLKSWAHAVACTVK